MDEHLPRLTTFFHDLSTTCLDLSDNWLTVGGIQTLVAALFQPHSCLQKLQLCNNWFGPLGADALATALEANVQLQDLDVSNWLQTRPADTLGLSRDLDQRVVQRLADALRVHPFS